MCLRPISLINPARKISLVGGQRYRLEVPCGQCAECKKATQDEYSFRSYYQSKYTYDLGGYVYFDTLTYDNANLPHISDFVPELKGSLVDYSCFNLDDYRMFFVRLRRMLEYHGFNVKDNLKYFLTSEYGTSDEGTHRPHYHIMFFVTDPSLDPLDLSRYVNKCWQKGRTDGIDYHPATYVMNHVFGKNYSTDEVHMRMVANYVSKYVTKDSSFQQTIDNRISIVMHRLHDDEWYESDRGKEFVKKLKRQMCQFHRQSQGFGIAALLPQYCNFDEVFETGMMTMEDSKSIKKHIPIPGYYSRKLFYDLIKDFDGHARWELNELGLKFKYVHLMKSFDIMTVRFEDWYKNLRIYCLQSFDFVEECDDNGKIVKRHPSSDEVDKYYNDIKNRVDEIMKDRTWKDYVYYLLCYKGRIKTPEQVRRESKGIYRVDDMYTIVYRGFTKIDDIPQDKIIYNYAHCCYKKKFGDKFVTDKDLGDKYSGFDYHAQSFTNWADNMVGIYGFKPSLLRTKFNPFTRIHRFGSMKSVDRFEQEFVINDKSDSRFHDFDELFTLYSRSMYYYNIRKQQAFDCKEGVKKRLKRFMKKSI